MKNEYGIQLYSVRDSMEKNVEETLYKIAELGYKYVEFAGFFGRSAIDIKQILDDNGLICSGTHSGINGLLPSNIMESIEFHKTIGASQYIIPCEDLGDLKKVERFCNVVNYAQPILAAEGIDISFHNHCGEFETMPWGSTIHSELEKRTNISFEIDTFWAFYANLDPIQVMERLKNRIRVIHVKDGTKEHWSKCGKPLGLGEAPVQAVVEYASRNNIRMVVESETMTPTGLDEAAKCMEYLKSLEA